jgi:hypothetical protein
LPLRERRQTRVRALACGWPVGQPALADAIGEVIVRIVARLDNRAVTRGVPSQLDTGDVIARQLAFGRLAVGGLARHRLMFWSRPAWKTWA